MCLAFAKVTYANGPELSRRHEASTIMLLAQSAQPKGYSCSTKQNDIYIGLSLRYNLLFGKYASDKTIEFCNIKIYQLLQSCLV